MKIIWTKHAHINLNDIVSYIANDNPEYAILVHDNIYKAIEHLSVFPLIGRIGKVKGTRELVSCYPYIIIYKIKSEHIEILRIIHGAQRYP